MDTNDKAAAYMSALAQHPQAGASDDMNNAWCRFTEAKSKMEAARKRGDSESVDMWEVHVLDAALDMERLGKQAEIADLRAQLARQRQDSKPTDLSKRLRESANAVMLADDRARLMTKAADEIERYYGGMLAWKRTAEDKDRKLIELRQHQGEPIYQYFNYTGFGGWIDTTRADYDIKPTHDRRIVYTTPAAQADEVMSSSESIVRDAARYRFIRDNLMEDYELPGSFHLSDGDPEHGGTEGWDRTIDAAMRTTAADNQTKGE